MLQQAKEQWDLLSNFRKKRNRCRDYTYGRQWNDIIEVDGRKISEYEYIISEGNVPLKNNLIRRIVRNVLGVFRKQLPDIMKKEYLGMDSIVEANSLQELFCRTLEEFLISGMAVHKKRISMAEGLPGIWTEVVSPGNFFFNTDASDVRGRDINLIGQIHAVNFSDWCSAFVSTPEDFLKAKKIFHTGMRYIKVTEVWRKELVPRYLVHDKSTARLLKLDAPDPSLATLGDMPKKWILDPVWRFYFLSDDGEILHSGDSPYIHGGHPYVMKCYPFIDGEIHSFVGDMIDQQRYTNRLITLYDWVIRASAKGVLLLPQGAVEPENLRDVCDQWGRFNGVIVYKADPSKPEPRQVSGNMSNLGVSELLEIQLKMMEDVSGVNGILQGNTSGGNVSGELYNSQTTNALNSLSDLLETFNVFIHESAQKDSQLLLQTFGKYS